jgi:hypothetical protein
MKNYQNLLGAIIIAAAIIIASIIIANSINGAGQNIGDMVSNALGTLKK